MPEAAARRRVSVGLGEIGVAEQDDDLLCVYGLGSCVALALYDVRRPRAALAHVVLPDSRGRPVPDPGRYGDTAVDALLDRLRRLGSRRSEIAAAIAGGASVLPISQDVGRHNVEAVRSALRRAALPLVDDASVGGRRGRTVEFDLQTRRLRVRELKAPSLAL